ncbi:hypothetical protein HB852_07765 [Listeria grandensis]|uniref:hypothetical protein n=1 Tax=Listeria grandensis TaxID=1494963 RepID=UPI0016280464|nr:hypothetical protein [Listeria grandensis]MBC1474512.1 hypothetical protein [Listeria grandensis]
MFLIELRVPGLRSFHPLRKSQKRTFSAAAPNFFSPDGHVQHLGLSSFARQTFGTFTSSAKIKKGFSLRRLQVLSVLTGTLSILFYRASRAKPSEFSHPPQKSKADFYGGCYKFFQV